MKRIVSAAFLLFALLLAFTGSSIAAESTAPLLGPSDLTYIGSFKTPTGQIGSDTFEYSTGFISGNVYDDPVDGKTLFIKGYLSAGYVSQTSTVVQIRIPTTLQNIDSVGVGGLPTATVVRGFSNASGGISAQILSSYGNGFGSLIVHNGKLIGTESAAYDATCSQSKSAWVSSLNFTNPSGPYSFSSNVTPRIIGGGYTASVPPEWQSALGGEVVSGNGPWSIISCGSPGPALFTIDADALANQPAANSVINSIPLVYYAENSTQASLGHWNSNDPSQIVNGKTIPSVTVTNPADGEDYTIAYEDNSMRIRGMLFPDGTRSVLFFGNKGLGPYCYGVGSLCGDPERPGSGDHAYPYADFVWAYDANDLAAAKSGQKEPWDVLPYNGWILEKGGGGVAWDAATRLAYMVEECAGPNCTPVINVFHVSGSSGSSYTVTPSAGANGSISPNTAQTINSGSTTQFTVTPNSGYTASVGGTCGGTLVGTTYTTNVITANCTVAATFADTTAPSTPTDMDARSSSTSTVDLSWVASTDAVGVTSYRVDYCSGFGCSSWATLGTSATNSYTHTGITPATNPTIYRYRVYALDAANNLSGAATSIYFNAVPTIPAFPGAEGGGAASKGGRGGTVYHVTSLDGGTGAGTLRACVAASGPRTCVFDVAGNIELTGNINISLPYITIAGHTAPGGGITISGKNSTQVSLTVRTHNVTIRGIRIRKGYNSGTPDQDGDSVNVLSTAATASPVGPVIFDHVSISWGQDENAGAWALTTRAPKNITYQWVMMYEPLLAHPVNFMTGAYNNATAERMTDIDVHHSIFANSSHRNPLIKNKTFRLVNNLIYNWGDWASAIEGTVQADLIGNRYKTGPLYQTISSKAYEIQLNPTGDASTPTLGSPSLYVIGNVGLHNTDPLVDNWGMTRLIDIPINAGVELGPLSESYRRFTPLSALPFPITAQDVWTAETIVLAGAGASRRLDCSGNWVSNRDSADARVVVEYTAGNAGIIPANEDAVGGYPTLATGTACADGDGDGMPDTWETANGLNASSASDGPTLHASGYSNLEMYLAGSSSETTPVLSNLLPTSNLARTATSATLQATTDQTATCRYALGSGTPYAGMTPFSNTASTTHSSNVSIVAGGVYQYCVRCMGTSLVSDESCTRFAVDPNPKKRVRH